MTQPSITDSYGENVFSIKTMREYLSSRAYKSLSATICEGRSLDASIADEVADAMKTWALANGATHFTHWFQPLTGATAEKHDSFIMPDHEGGALTQFSAKELIQSEPDASSFPSGGIRTTFEARGYTAWDPTSPAFLKKTERSATLCIPSVFCSYHGEALDKKTPLLRSMKALSDQACRLAGLFGIDHEGRRAIAELGVEQEYFLVDKRFYESRLDLMQTGRTLFGRAPAKHQQMDDHYFGIIKRRVMNFMDHLDRELWKLGIPAKTRHNEVCPGQFEIAPVFEEQNLAVDHNMLVMETLRDIAEQHNFACLLHEKPYAGVNGSGKHNNWNVKGPDGKNWLSSGEGPQDNARFLTMICALMKAVDTHAGLLRSSVASAGNDHRLGANEAPPAIMSIFLGDQLTELVEQLEHGGTKKFEDRGVIEIGVSSLPKLPRDLTDRNRTSPFAFTGSKFEFRAVGSSQSSAPANIVLNTIVAEALDDICSTVESAMKDGANFNDALQQTLSGVVSLHKRILFNGDNYTREWAEEAEERGLPNVRTTPKALKAMIDDRTIKTFEKYSVLSRRELESRYEVYKEEYKSILEIEARCAIHMARSMVVPCAVEYQTQLAASLTSCKDFPRHPPTVNRERLLHKIGAQTEKTLQLSEIIEASLGGGGITTADLPSSLRDLRKCVDILEGILPHSEWPLPTYTEMMFML